MGFGKWHNIEVEDDVTAYVEYPNGATGIFVTTTADVPGTNRLEVTGTRGSIIMENGKLTFRRSCVDVSHYCATTRNAFDPPEVWECAVPVSGDCGNQHRNIVENFADAIRNGTELIAPGPEGIHGLTISNAMHLSAWLGKTIELPLDEELYIQMLQEKIAASTIQKEDASINFSMGSSFTL